LDPIENEGQMLNHGTKSLKLVPSYARQRICIWVIFGSKIHIVGVYICFTKLHGIYKVKNISTHVWLVKIYLNNGLFPTMQGYKREKEIIVR
jgi:hypothetical protein